MNLQRFLEQRQLKVASKCIIQEFVKKKIIQYSFRINTNSAYSVLGLHGRYEKGIEKLVLNTAQRLDRCNFFLFRTPIHIPSDWISEDAVPELQQFLQHRAPIISIHGTRRQDIFLG